MTAFSSPTSELARQALVATLRREVEKLEGLRLPADDRLLSTGVPALDRVLPGGGLLPGSLVEYLSPGPGSAAGTLALAAARAACQEGRVLVVLDRQGTFYPPAAAAWGIECERLLILRPEDAACELWALDQALRLSGGGSGLGAPRLARQPRFSPPATRSRSGRQRSVSWCVPRGCAASRAGPKCSGK